MKNKISISNLFDMKNNKYKEKVSKTLERIVNDDVNKEIVFNKFLSDYREFVRIDYKAYGGLETWRN